MPERSLATDRYHHDLDAARGVLMILGVVLHAANAYGARGDWLVHDPPGRAALDVVSDAIHLFRMPAFFLLSGFFAAMTIGRRGADAFVRVRLLRLGLPLVTTALTLNTLQEWVLYRHAGGALSPLGWARSGALLDAWRAGSPVTHLWFLVHLLAYVAAAWVLVRWRPTRALLGGLEAGLRRGLAPLAPSGLFLLLLPLASLGAHVAAWATPWTWSPVWGGIHLHALLWWTPFFAVGALLFRAPELFTAFGHPRPWLLPATALAAWAAWRAERADVAGAPAEIGTVLLVALPAWLACPWVLAVFRRVGTRGRRVFAWLSDGSYTIYLVHHLTVILLVLGLAGASLGPWTKCALVVLGTTAVTVAVHQLLVLRSPLLRLLLNGKRLRRRGIA